jgi:anti-anti-sigma factor
MELSTFIAGDSVAVLTLAGELDLEVAADVAAAGQALLAASQCSALSIDMAGVEFIDSTAIGALVTIRNSALADGREVRLRNPSAKVVRVLRLTGLADVFLVEMVETRLD